MKNFICLTDPVLFSLFGGAILGTGIGSIISLISTSPFPQRWVLNLTGFFLLLISGFLFNYLSIVLSKVRIVVESAPDIILKKIDKKTLLDSHYEAKKLILNLLFWSAIVLMILAIILIIYEPIFNIEIHKL